MIFGASIVHGGAQWRVYAPVARDVRVTLHGGAAPGEHRMHRDAEGVWELEIAGASAGDLYQLRLDEAGSFPDPASRFQPQGVHGPSEILNPAAFPWTDAGWTGVAHAELVVYELHVGTFTTAGTFDGVRAQLPALRDLGITAIELMPIADFAGDRNWGYDGVALYAPSRAYGRPEALRALVDRAHALGIGVILDVVYNHLGPEGAYMGLVNPQYFHGRSTPWGCAVNLDGPGSRMVRRFIIDNAVHWLREYHLDGLRLDATHALVDEGTHPFMREFSEAARAAAAWPIVLHAEDHRNLDQIVLDGAPAAWGFDGVWADDFHHVVRRMVAGDEHGYYQDFEGSSEELARTVHQGWLFTGGHSHHLKTARGTDPSHIPMDRFVVCIQNHDQIGNRALGERLNHQVDAATWRAISVLLLTAPMTPLLFMGQEWAAGTPFLYFTDLEPDLGREVTAGRRREFADFPEFSRPEDRERIPDPQSPRTFDASRLRWEERKEPPHAATLTLYRELLDLRRREPALQASSDLSVDAFAPDSDSLVVRRRHGDTSYWITVRLRNSGIVDLGAWRQETGDTGGPCETVLTTEDPGLAVDAVPLRIRMEAEGPIVEFARPGAAVFKFSTSNR